MQLIRDSYRKEQEALHAKGNYGTASLKYGAVISNLVDTVKADTLLDYGCGSMRSLLKVLNPERDLVYMGYDPAVKEFSKKEPCDLVVCIDVLEHIEPDLLDNVLDDLMMLAKKWAFLTVHTGPAVKVLSDGRNAHLIQKPASWWLPSLMKRWDLQTFNKTGAGFNVLMRAR
jgi:2-polyprenyl-3-methyl-5-hydroxy-6-metoxy-1,4-benzoquinol methylase